MAALEHAKAEGFEIREMTVDDLSVAVDWAADEGWNPGNRDAECFRSVDPAGFLMGFLDGSPATAISVVNYDSSFAFLGFYLVRKGLRGRGLGFATWRAGLDHAGDRVVGLDGVVDQQDNYKSEGFAFAHRNMRYGGKLRLAPATLPSDHRLVGAADLPEGLLDAYDRRCFPAQRSPFIAAWTRAPGHVARALLGPHGVAGYGVLRPCRSGFKVGPLFADGPAQADALLMDLCAEAGAGPVFLDPPGSNSAAVELARKSGLEPVFETARMYRGPAPEIDDQRVFGISTFELG